jgi:2'-hydroxyisoflavone reductase
VSLNRRSFLRSSALVGGAAGLGLGTSPGALRALSRLTGPTPVSRAPAPLKLLVLGGTRFLGPALVEYAMARGHTVTLFNRGQSNPGLFPNVEKLQGDRDAKDGYASLGGARTWDVVVDVPTTLPRWVNGAADALAKKTNHYLFISTISVFRDYSQPGIDENGPLHAAGDPLAERMGQTAETQYGPLKVRCEMLARERFGANVTIVRPGLIVGPGDLSDRFSYWPVRIEKGGDVLAPGTPDDPTQYVDVRDLGEWVVRLAEQRVFGTFNATGPNQPTTISEMLHGIKAVTTTGARFTWVPAEFLAQQQVRPWSDMPVWVPPVGDSTGFMRIDCSKAYAAGLTFRPLADTARDTLAWYHTRPPAQQATLRAGLAPERERAVLEAWRAVKR